MNEHFGFHNLYEQLTQGALAELEFLQLVDQYPSLHTAGPILDNAIRRYEHFWLPLVARYTGDDKERGKDTHFSLRAAPLDVAWVWHVHMLSPVAYQRHCMSLFKKILNHDYRSRDLNKGRQLWQDSDYAEPFDVDLVTPPFSVPEYNSQISYDLRSAAFRQSKFYYNVSLPHYKDPIFLEAAYERYKHHLHLKKTIPHLFAVPCYDFDLIWHAHQLYPLTYFSDMKALLGFVLDHDDTETGRVPGSKLYESEMLTRKAWANSGMPFAKRGAMYRGEPLPRIPPKTLGRFSCLAANDFEVNIMSVNANLNPNKKFQIVIHVGESKVKLTVKGGIASFGKKSKSIHTFTTNPADDENISVALYQKRFLGKKKLQYFRVYIE